MITVGISDLNIAKDGDVLVTYALGSCIGICLYDGMHRIAGLSHIMLPDSSLSAAPGNEMKFADTAIPMLLKKMQMAGAQQAYIKAKIAGGAQMFAMDKNSSVANIGERNAIAVKNILSKLRIPIIAEDTGKNYGRTLFFGATDGVMKIKSALHGEANF